MKRGAKQTPEFLEKGSRKKKVLLFGKPKKKVPPLMARPLRP